MNETESIWRDAHVQLRWLKAESAGRLGSPAPNPRHASSGVSDRGSPLARRRAPSFRGQQRDRHGVDRGSAPHRSGASRAAADRSAARCANTSWASCLGRAVAHEIGHYLLKATRIRHTGLMRASIDAREFADLRTGAFRLDRESQAYSGRSRPRGTRRIRPAFSLLYSFLTFFTRDRRALLFSGRSPCTRATRGGRRTPPHWRRMWSWPSPSHGRFRSIWPRTSPGCQAAIPVCTSGISGSSATRSSRSGHLPYFHRPHLRAHRDGQSQPSQLHRVPESPGAAAHRLPRRRHHLQRRVPADDGADGLRHVPPGQTRHRSGRGIMARRCAVRVEPAARRAGHRALQPGGRGAARDVPADPREGRRTRTVPRRRRARRHRMARGEHGRLLRRVLSADRRDLPRARASSRSSEAPWPDAVSRFGGRSTC